VAEAVFEFCDDRQKGFVLARLLYCDNAARMAAMVENQFGKYVAQKIRDTLSHLPNSNCNFEFKAVFEQFLTRVQKQKKSAKAKAKSYSHSYWAKSKPKPTK
jgi:citrate lyase gamma subunit